VVTTTPRIKLEIRPGRRLTVILGPLASIAVAATSFRAATPAVVVPLTCLWLTAFALGALWPKGGPAVLIALGVTVKLMTVALVIAVLALHSRLGPHSPLEWIPLGMLNAATGIWFLRLIRGEAQ
jgi:hypothetical protein